MGRALGFAGSCGAAFAAAILVGCGGSSAEVVARVGSVAITAGALNHWIAVEHALHPSSAHAGDGPQGTALGFLISAQWTLGEARELGIRVSEEAAKREAAVLSYELRAGMAFGGVPREAELRQLLGSHASNADQEWVVSLAMLDARIRQARVVQAAQHVPRAAVVAYYARHQRRFFVPEHRKVGVIETSALGPMLKAKREIKSGKAFGSVARRVSQDLGPHGEWTLEMTRQAAGLAVSKLVGAMFGAEAHALVGPRRGVWFYLFEVLHVIPAHELPLGRAEHTIVQDLATAQAMTALRAEDERKWAARTACAPGYVARECGHGPGAA